MAGFDVGSVELRQAGQEMVDANENLMQQLQQLAAAVDAVAWKGQAATAFKSLMTAFNNDAKRLNDALMNMAEQVAGSADAYEAQEQAAQESLTGITQALDGI